MSRHGPVEQLVRGGAADIVEQKGKLGNKGAQPRVVLDVKEDGKAGLESPGFLAVVEHGRDNHWQARGRGMLLEKLLPNASHVLEQAQGKEGVLGVLRQVLKQGVDQSRA